MLRILQINAIGAGGPDFEEDRLIDELQEGLRDIAEASEVDYVAVCGDATQGGEPEHYEILVRFLERLEGQVLVPESKVYPKERRAAARRSRIIVVPGRQDAPRGVGLGPFGDFCEDFYRRPVEAGLMAAFDPNRATLRQMKDMTLLGFPYWCGDTPEEGRRAVSRLAERLRGLVRDPQLVAGRGEDQVLEYLQRTPTILLSAGSPIFNPDLVGSEELMGLRRALRPYLPIALHLVGSGPVHLVPYQPFFLRYVTLTNQTIPQSAGYPLQMNLIELTGAIPQAAYDSAPRREAGESAVGLQTCLKRSPQQDWETERGVDGHLDRFMPWPEDLCELTDRQILEPLTSELATMIKTEGCAVVTGFPCAGKRAFREYLLGCDILGEEKVNARPFSWRGGDRSARIKEEAQRLRHEAERLGPGAPRCLIVTGPVYVSPQLSDEQARRLAIDDVSCFFDAMISAGAIPVVFMAGKTPQGFDLPQLDLGSLDEGYFMKLVQRSSLAVPLRADHVRSLTGNYVGFTELLFRHTGGSFARYPGIHPVSAATSSELIHEFFKGADLGDELKYFFDHFQHWSGVPQIFELLGRRVEEAIHKDGLAGLSELVVCEEELRQAGISDSALRKALVRLTRPDGILRPQPSNGGGRCFHLALPLPFAVHSGAFAVFLSYGSEVLREARRLREGLEDLGVRVYDYSAKRRVPNAGLTIDERIAKELRDSPNLVWFHDGSDGIRSSTVQEELHAWRKMWWDRRPPERRGRHFAVALGSDPQWPEVFTKTLDKLVEPEVNERLVRNIWRQLVSVSDVRFEDGTGEEAS